MADLTNLVIRISVSKGISLGKVNTKQKTWKTFCAMFDPAKVLVDTTISFAGYQALDVDEKGKKKMQAGNWMPALFTDGIRKGPNQRCRTMISFDLDYVTHEQLDHIRLALAPISEFAWHMHTTRSHCPEKPRVRMTLPISREVNLVEANALTRYGATLLADDPEEGIEIPDIVSMKANQVMYLPSRSRDQEYWTDVNNGKVLDVDEFLARYPGWEDFALLPYKESEKHKAAIDPDKKMEDPCDKKGIIGAWCRTYDVEEAIAEFIPEVYAPGDSTGTDIRYTYLLGTGSNGAVVYNGGKFLYSNHGTDPIEGAANSWDLVRIHKFGHLDEKSPANTLIGNLPSSKAMNEFARKDRAVAAELGAHMAAQLDDEFDDDDEDEFEPEDAEADPDLLAARAAVPEKKGSPSVADLLGEDDDEDEEPRDIADEFDDDPDDDDEEPDEKPKKPKANRDWMADFRRKANDELEPVLNNIALICENDPRLKDTIAYNEFTADPVCMKRIKSKKINLPSRPLRRSEAKRGRRWEDGDDAAIKLLASANAARGGYETDFSSQGIQEAVLIAGRNNLVHPVKNDIEACHAKWVAEGSPTGLIDRLAIEFFGCPDTPFHRESSRWYVIAMIARIYEPGCKFDQMLILEGATGAGKSTWLKCLSLGYFGEFRVDLDRIDRTVEAMRGKWLLEMAEMVKAKSSDSALLKDFLSSASDTIRLAYAKREMEFPRQSVMAGTSNENDYLTDPTSVRRYWVWRVHERFGEDNMVDTERMTRVAYQVIGEARQAYLDLRVAQPHGDLHLGLKSKAAMSEQRMIAEGSRRLTATEAISEVIAEWLDRPATRDEVEATSTHPLDAQFDDDADDGARFLRNMVTAKQAFESLRLEPVLAPYRNADVRTFGKALKLIPGWAELGQVRRHGQKAVWFSRNVKDEREWIEAPKRLDADDLLG